MKIYTKTGDKGETSLGSGKRLLKNSSRVVAYGDIDELNAALGVCRAQNEDKFLEEIFRQIQKDLMVVGADLASPVNKKIGGRAVPRIQPSYVKRLEDWIDTIDGVVEPLQNFILPGGTLLAAHLHLARTICRRAERSLVILTQEEKISDQLVIYLNRLSDLLFMMARYANKLASRPEEKWMSDGSL